MPLIIKKNVKELIDKQAMSAEVRNELLSQFDKQAITNALKEAEKLKALRLAGLKALCYLQVTLESHKVQLLQNALMIEADILSNKMKIENEIAYNLKRKELIQEGKLEKKRLKNAFSR